jgi:hypothetical protein
MRPKIVAGAPQPAVVSFGYAGIRFSERGQGEAPPTGE